MNEIEIIEKSLEKSNLILKKFKLLKQNNYEIESEKTINVANELVEHLKSTYSYKKCDIIELMSSYYVNEEIINAVGGSEIAIYIAESVKNILKEE